MSAATDSPAGARDPLHVLAVVDGMHAGGAELLIAEFARVAADVGVRLSVCGLDGSTDGPAAERLRRLGVTPQAIRVRRLLDPRDVRDLRARIAAIGPDVVHTHLTYADTIGGLAARSLGIPVVSTIHSDQIGASRRERAKDHLAALVRRHCCARVVAVSEQARATYLATGWDRPEHVVTVRNGVAARPHPGGGAAIRRELGIAPDAPVVLMLSMLRPEKCHVVAIQAIGQLLADYPDLRLLIPGYGPERDAVEAAAAKVGGAALALGHRDDVMDLLDASDVLLHSSRTEAFPTALVEAMASSIPVVATAVGGIPEIVRDGETGLLVEPPPRADRFAAALRTLLGDPALRERLGRAGRERYERELTGDAWAGRLRAVYDDAARVAA